MFNFYNQSRLGQDKSVRNIQNTKYSDYLTSNLMFNVSTPVHLANNQPGLIYQGSHMGDLAQSIMSGVTPLQLQQENNKLQLEQLDLYARPFATVPYLGRGTVDPTVESKIMQGDSIVNRRDEFGRSLVKESENTNYKPLIINYDNMMKDVGQERLGYNDSRNQFRDLNR